MDLLFIKTELEKLTALVASWSDDASIASIERDIALDKIKDIYNAMRFEAQPTAPIAAAAAPVVEEAINTEDEADVKDVEVEFIFAEEDFEMPTVADSEEPSQEEPAEQEAPQQQVEESKENLPKSHDTPVASNDVAEEPQQAKVVAEPVSAPSTPPSTEHEKKPAMDSLFGGEEIRRQPRTKHQRMMSIYDDAPSRHEKAVDISKIFDMDIDVEREPAVQKSAPQSHKPQPAKQEPIAVAAQEEKPMILGDAIAANTHTLADTIATPTPLAEEITHSRIRSLRDAIGINDKFLMIRDLFDGDGDAYEQTISELDALESFDDCMIYIVENHAWNPESEGAKFMMQLLERKLV